MKTLFIVLLFTFASGCGSSSGQKENGKSATEASSTGTVTSSEQLQNSILLGEIEKKDFLSPPFDDWFVQTYDTYEPSHKELEEIRKEISDIDEIKIFMGTWCADSQREVPNIFKILELTNFDLDKVHMVAVDRSKTAPDDSHTTYGVTRVPTIIFYRDGEELNRFVEYPIETFEKDIANIVSGREYKNAYAQ